MDALADKRVDVMAEPFLALACKRGKFGCVNALF